MKIFILNPLLFTGKLSKIARKRQPLELAYIASLLRRDNEIKLVDANALELNLNQTIQEIRNFNPDILILTSTPVDRWEVPSHEHIKLLIKNIVQTIKNIHIPYIILTGAHGTVMPEYIFKKTSVPPVGAYNYTSLRNNLFIVRSEPELIVKNLVNEIDGNKNYKNIAGISYYDENNNFINNPLASRNQNLDDLPLPAYDLLPMEKYSYTFKDIPRPFSIILSSRGCPFNCTYCLKVMMPDKYIARSPENVFQEIKYLVEKFNIQGIYFQDWEFLINQERVAEICDLIIQEPVLKNLKWGCNARASDINEKIVTKMKAAGCVRINIGFESGSQKILDLANKKIKIEEIKNALKICRQHNINIGIYSILNLPGENKKTIAETEKFLIDNNLKTMCAPNLPIPYPGTKLYEILIAKEGREVPWEDLEKYTGRVGVNQQPLLAKIYRWHYKYKYIFGNWYFLKIKFYKILFKRFFV